MYIHLYIYPYIYIYIYIHIHIGFAKAVKKEILGVEAEKAKALVEETKIADVQNEVINK
jgi:hypothetical protein